MTLTVHRVTHQIGGIVAEIATARHKVFIDIGSNLRETDAPLLLIDGLRTKGQVFRRVF